MNRYMYLDDKRIPKTNKNWVIVKSYDEAVSYVQTYGIPNYCSFDHDFGSEKSGYDFAHWLVKQDLDNIHTFPEGFKFNVHSANGPGAINIQTLLDGYLRFKIQNE